MISIFSLEPCSCSGPSSNHNTKFSLVKITYDRHIAKPNSQFQFSAIQLVKHVCLDDPSRKVVTSLPPDHLLSHDAVAAPFPMSSLDPPQSLFLYA